MKPDVVYVSSIDWSFLWQVHQEIAVRLARAGHRVFYVENTGIRAPAPGDAARIAARLGNWARAARSHGWRPVAPSITAHAPLVMPPFAGPVARTLNRRVFLPRLRRSAERAGLGAERLLFTFLPTDTALDLVEMLRTPRSVLVYYCLADFAQLAPRPGPLRAIEDQLLARADLVLANSPLMAHRFRRAREAVHLFPPGIDLGAFPDPAGAPPALEAGDERLLRSLPRPVIGYVGGLHRFVDFALLAAMARARPDWSWVLVGPPQVGPASLGPLRSLPNVHLLGERRHERLAGIIARFDAAIIPYRVDGATESVMPVKLNEYLAMGRPVAASALPPVREVAAGEGVVEVAEAGADAFLAAIERALASGAAPDLQARRRRVAARADWDAQFERLARLVEERLAAVSSAAKRR